MLVGCAHTPSDANCGSCSLDRMARQEKHILELVELSLTQIAGFTTRPSSRTKEGQICVSGQVPAFASGHGHTQNQPHLEFLLILHCIAFNNCFFKPLFLARILTYQFEASFRTQVGRLGWLELHEGRSGLPPLLKESKEKDETKRPH